MKATILLKKFHMDKKEFVTAVELKRYCKEFHFDYTSLVRYLERWRYLVRIFYGIFYIRYPEELSSEFMRYNHLELVSHGMKLKGIKDWYFGFHTALKLNNLTHEYFAIDDVVSDKIFRSKPITITERKFKFTKISSKLINFGIKNNGVIRYSDSEKTILDFIYKWKANGIPSRKILSDISDWTTTISKNNLENYSKKYPLSVKKIVEEILK